MSNQSDENENITPKKTFLCIVQQQSRFLPIIIALLACSSLIRDNMGQIYDGRLPLSLSSC
jgi:hypothetical protein